MTIIKWEDPPLNPRKRGSGWNGTITDALLEKPNEWALVFEAPITDSFTRQKCQNKGQNLRTSAARRGFNIQVTFVRDGDMGRVYARLIKEQLS